MARSRPATAPPGSTRSGCARCAGSGSGSRAGLGLRIGRRTSPLTEAGFKFLGYAVRSDLRAVEPGADLYNRSTILTVHAP